MASTSRSTTAERLLLRVDRDELKPWEAEGIRRLAAEAADPAERIESEREFVGRDVAAIELGDLLECVERTAEATSVAASALA